ncbi:hypothetical protein BST85_04165 [Aureitalea marina]|uniref:ThuA-like domain-containing protein n=2 Tax=Aureitalea marina TaxID=930804 RepID=A0A2S7KNH7_9FLAO|nr:hypothetical protein BST85_04165 [Aureitalea marina]
MFWLYLPLSFFLWAFTGNKEVPDQSQQKLRALILDGQNNHYIWPKTSQMMKSYLEETGLFEVNIVRSSQIDLGIKYNPNRPYRLDQYLWEYPLKSESSQRQVDRVITDPNYAPDFDQHDLVVLNFGIDAAPWPKTTQKEFEDYMNNGGGLVVIHAANNSFGNWDEYNKMIGLGAWGGRDQDSGPYVYLDQDGKETRDKGAGICGSHGPEHEFLVTTRDKDHPIMQGLPEVWMHAKDELYDRMRGPAENMTILATAYSDLEQNDPPWDQNTRGSERNEPMLMVTRYGQGRVFHSALGHFDYSQECVGFITTFQRGSEWAATGGVTQAVPKDFPRKNRTSSRPWNPNAELAQLQKERRDSNPYQQWLTLVNSTPSDSIQVYSDAAIAVNDKWNTQSGKDDIRKAWQQFSARIDSSWTMNYVLANNRGRHAYEIGGFRTNYGQLFGQFVIWELNSNPKRRLFEFTVPAEIIEIDKTELDQRRKEWMQYCNAHRVDQLVNELYTKDALYYNHRPLIKGREAILREYSYMNNPSYQLELNPLIVQPLREDLVIEIGQCAGGYNGKYILIWERNKDGLWQIALDSNI